MGSAEEEINEELSGIKVEYENLRSQLCKLENLLCKENGGEFGLSTRLQLEASKLFNTDKFSDVQVILKGGTHIKAHKMILAASGDDWGVEQFDHVDMLDLTDLRYDVGYALMHWVYTDDFGGYSIQLDDNFFIEMMQAAKVCKLKALHIRCQKALSTMVNNETCERFLKLSEEFEAKILKENCEKLLKIKSGPGSEDIVKVDNSMGNKDEVIMVADDTGQLIPLKMCLERPELPTDNVAGVVLYDTPNSSSKQPILLEIENNGTIFNKTTVPTPKKCSDQSKLATDERDVCVVIDTELKLYNEKTDDDDDAEEGTPTKSSVQSKLSIDKDDTDRNRNVIKEITPQLCCEDPGLATDVHEVDEINLNPEQIDIQINDGSIISLLPIIENIIDDQPGSIEAIDITPSEIDNSTSVLITHPTSPKPSLSINPLRHALPCVTDIRTVTDTHDDSPSGENITFETTNPEMNKSQNNESGKESQELDLTSDQKTDLLWMKSLIEEPKISSRTRKSARIARKPVQNKKNDLSEDAPQQLLTHQAPANESKNQPANYVPTMEAGSPLKTTDNQCEQSKNIIKTISTPQLIIPKLSGLSIKSTYVLKSVLDENKIQGKPKHLREAIPPADGGDSLLVDFPSAFSSSGLKSKLDSVTQTSLSQEYQPPPKKLKTLNQTFTPSSTSGLAENNQTLEVIRRSPTMFAKKQSRVKIKGVQKPTASYTYSLLKNHPLLVPQDTQAKLFIQASVSPGSVQKTPVPATCSPNATLSSVFQGTTSFEAAQASNKFGTQKGLFKINNQPLKTKPPTTYSLLKTNQSMRGHSSSLSKQKQISDKCKNLIKSKPVITSIPPYPKPSSRNSISPLTTKPLSVTQISPQKDEKPSLPPPSKKPEASQPSSKSASQPSSKSASQSSSKSASQSSSKPVPNYLYKCPICEIGFSSLMALHYHSKNPKNSHFECPKCGKSCNAQLGFCIHCFVSSQKKESKATDANDTNNSVILVVHPKTTANLKTGVEEQTQGPENELKNKDCKNALQPKLKKICKKRRRPAVKRFKKCSICEKMINHYNFSGHMRSHSASGEKPYKCGVCSRGYNLYTTFTSHIKKYPTNHTVCSGCDLVLFEAEQKDHVCGIKLFRPHRPNTSQKPLKQPVICEICGKEFHTKTYLKYHIKHVHDKVKPFQCDVCGKTLTKYIKRHMMLHKNDKRFMCQICGRINTSRTNLQRHMVIHSDAKPFICDICGLTMKMKSTLKTHMRSHSEIAKHQCKVCNKKFQYSNKLITHMKRHEGTKDIPCHQCDRKFYSIGIRNEHYQKYHLGKKTMYPCRYCDQSFSFSSSRSRHSARFHKDVFTPKPGEFKRLERTKPANNIMEPESDKVPVFDNTNVSKSEAEIQINCITEFDNDAADFASESLS